MQRNIFLFIVLLSTICGCGVPADLPPLAEFEISVKKNGTSAEGCIITIHSDSLPNKYGCYGVLNSSGSLSCTTYELTSKRKFSGAPVGLVKIGIRRDGSFGMEDPQKASRGMTREESDKYAAERAKKIAENEKYVPMSLGDPLISPIEFDVVDKQPNKLTIELDDPKWDITIDPRRLRKY